MTGLILLRVIACYNQRKSKLLFTILIIASALVLFMNVMFLRDLTRRLFNTDSVASELLRILLLHSHCLHHYVSSSSLNLLWVAHIIYVPGSGCIPMTKIPLWNVSRDLLASVIFYLPFFVLPFTNQLFTMLTFYFPEFYQCPLLTLRDLHVYCAGLPILS